jgi:uncharacterized ion transporter superfamily protein YfcC
MKIIEKLKSLLRFTRQNVLIWLVMIAIILLVIVETIIFGWIGLLIAAGFVIFLILIPTIYGIIEKKLPDERDENENS